MTHSDLVTLAMPLLAVAAIALTGVCVVFQATHRADRSGKRARSSPDGLKEAAASGRFPVVLLSKREFNAYIAFVKKHPDAAE